MNRGKELAKNSLIIAIGRVSTQFISFLLLPLYTTLLSVKEYGIVELISTLVQLLIPITSLMIDQGVFRHLLVCKTAKDKRRTISSAFFILTGLNALFLLILNFVMPFVNITYKNWVPSILVATSYSNFFLQIARGEKKSSDYALGSFICSVSTIVLNLFCIAWLRMGAVGMLIASFSANVICSIFLFMKLKIYQNISLKNIDRVLAIKELKYSVPLVPNQLSLWVMNSSDRIIVTFILGTAANGILAVSHKFPSIFMSLFNIFLLAWHETGAVHYYDDDRDDFFSGMIEKMITIFSTLCMGIIVILPIVFNWFVNPAYNEAYFNIPIYLIASLFNVIVGLLGVVYVAANKTFEIAKTTMIAAVLNIIINLLLIKSIGLYAASISTLIGYLVTMIYRIVDTKKYLKIKYNIKQYTIVIIGMLSCIYIYYLNDRRISFLVLPIFILLSLYINRSTAVEVFKFIKLKLGRI